MNYRIYQNVTGWEYLLTTNEEKLNSVISSLKDDLYIVIIKHYIADDMDEPYYSGYVEEYYNKKRNDILKITK